MIPQDKKLKRILLGVLLIALAMPLNNVYIIYPKFSAQLIKNFEDFATRLALHLESELEGAGAWSVILAETEPPKAVANYLKKASSGFGLYKMKIFSASGLTVYSTDRADVGKLNQNDYFQQIVAKGRIFSKVVKKQTESLEGQVFQADVVEIYVPVMRTGDFWGAFELYYDITDRIEALNRLIFIATIVPFIISGMLFTALLWGLKRLDRSIIAQVKVEQDLQASLGTLAEKNQQLAVKHHELVETHQQLQKTQMQMLQQEKMASVGQLAAGVAHEINNPLGFIAGNLRSLQKYLQKIIGYLDDEEKVCRTCLPPQQQAELQQLRKAAKIDYLLADIPDLLVESLDGADRVKEIVQNLKSFSRVDAAEFQEANLNDGLESAIKIIWNELKYKVTLHKDFSELPVVACYPQQLNQVFMNILLNAAQAIETKGEIWLKTWADQEQVHVSIRDTGCGISVADQQRIFEPFFTTKEVGKGTGLGMSIAYEIIAKHKGKIDLHSIPGEGTTFTLSLPLQASPLSD